MIITHTIRSRHQLIFSINGIKETLRIELIETIIFNVLSVKIYVDCCGLVVAAGVSHSIPHIACYWYPKKKKVGICAAIQ
jgi:hypothetical protein